MALKLPLVFPSLIFFLLFSLGFAYAETVELEPTDDAYVVADLNDVNDVAGFKKINTGDLDFLKIWYGYDVTENNNRIVSPAYLKFDLTNYSADDIESAHLKMYANDLALISDSKVLSVYAIRDASWTEESLTYENASTPPIVTESQVSVSNPGWYEWDLTSHAKEWAGSNMSIMVFFETLSTNQEELIIFTSKESENVLEHPSLKIVTKDSIAKSDSKILKLIPTDDAFIGLDFTNVNDVFGLRTLNTGNDTSLAVWYAYNVTDAKELIVATANMKFDLSGINPEDVIEANLKLYPHTIRFSGGEQVISAFDLKNNDWEESTASFANGPRLSDTEISFTIVDVPEKWYSWDVTDFVKNYSGSDASVSLGYQNFFSGHEEQAVFHSKESSVNVSPYLEIVMMSDNSEGGGCLIATATFGSEMVPQIQQLRELRDNTILSTESGTVFMSGFNQFYYSFSPHIADLERENPIFKELVRISLTPLLSSLSLLNYVDLDSEQNVLLYGLSIIFLNLGMYFATPFFAYKFTKKITKHNRRCN